MTGIICDSNSLGFLVNLGNIIGKPLGCSSYHINIHTVGSGSENSAKSGCSKFQRYCETMRTAVAAGLTGVGIGAAANGGTGAGIFSEQMAAATISLEDLEDKKATH